MKELDKWKTHDIRVYSRKKAASIFKARLDVKEKTYAKVQLEI